MSRILEALATLASEATRIRKAVEKIAARADVGDLMTVPQATKFLGIDSTVARRWMAERNLIHELHIEGRERPVRRVDRQELLRAVKRDGRPEPRPSTRTRRTPGRGLSALANAAKKAS